MTGIDVPAGEDATLEAVVGDALGRPISAVTPARVFIGHVSGSYRTRTLLQLGADHAMARSAVSKELDLSQDPLATAVKRFGLYEVVSRAGTHAEHLSLPERGRLLSDSGRLEVAENGRSRSIVQILVGDGLSAGAVQRHVPPLLELLVPAFTARGWAMNRPIVIRHCRVGIMADVGPISGADVLVLLIGERPGLSTPESLSIYFQWRPRPESTDADRNVIANIQENGLSYELAVDRAVSLVAGMLAQQTSGVGFTTDVSVGLPDAPPGLEDRPG